MQKSARFLMKTKIDALSMMRKNEAGNSPPTTWVPAVASAIVWMAASALGGYWVLLWPDPTPVPADAVPTMPAPSPSFTGLPRALGAAGVDDNSVAQKQVFELVGIVATGSGRGAALIGTNGQPPQPFQVGQVVADGLILQSLTNRLVRLGSQAHGPAAIELSLPDVR